MTEPVLPPHPEPEKPPRQVTAFPPTDPLSDANGTAPDRAAGRFRLRKARVGDVRQLLELINGFAAGNLMLPRGPQYLYETIRSFVVAVDPRQPVPEGLRQDDSRDGLVVACGSLNVLWEDLGEIRSTAIHPGYQKQGLGRRIVTYMIDEARLLGLHKLFTFTLAEGFFRSLGFERRERDALPSKVWGECSRCPKYFKCDEVGMILELDRRDA